jgi:hypothetical protein
VPKSVVVCIGCNHLILNKIVYLHKKLESGAGCGLPGFMGRFSALIENFSITICNREQKMLHIKIGNMHRSVCKGGVGMEGCWQKPALFPAFRFSAFVFHPT